MKRLKVFISVILLLLLSLPELSAARISGKKIGPNTLRKKIGDSSGGGLKYKNTAYKHLQREVDYLWRSLSGIIEEDFNINVAKYTTKKIDLLRFREIIQDIELAPMQEKPLKKRFNKDGNEEAIFFDYNIETGRIVALKGYLDMYHKAVLSEEEQKNMQLELMHEATHLFGIGIGIGIGSDDNKDGVSAKIAYSLRWSLGGNTTTDHHCGKNEPFDRRVEACNKSLFYIDVVYVDHIVNPFGDYVTDYTVEELGYQVLNTKDGLGVYVAYPYWYTTYKDDGTGHFVYNEWSRFKLEPDMGEKYCGLIGENWKLPSVDNVKYMLELMTRYLRSTETPMIATDEDGKLFSVNEDMEVEELSMRGLTWTSSSYKKKEPDLYNVICVSSQDIDK